MRTRSAAGSKAAIVLGLLRRKEGATTTDKSGYNRTTFRVLGEVPELENRFRLRAPALLILSSQEIEGRIVQYAADSHCGYEVTIESKVGKPSS